jgi:hypothetical protein
MEDEILEVSTSIRDNPSRIPFKDIIQGYHSRIPFKDTILEILLFNALNAHSSIIRFII